MQVLNLLCLSASLTPSFFLKAKDCRLVYKYKNQIPFIINKIQKNKKAFFYSYNLLKTYNLPTYLIFVPIIESSFKVNAVHKNKDGSLDIGLWQLNSKFFKHKNLFDYKVNSFLAVRYFYYLLKKRGFALSEAICYYNTGRKNFYCPYKTKIASFIYALKTYYCNRREQ